MRFPFWSSSGRKGLFSSDVLLQTHGVATAPEWRAQALNWLFFLGQCEAKAGMEALLAILCADSARARGPCSPEAQSGGCQSWAHWPSSLGKGQA